MYLCQTFAVGIDSWVDDVDATRSPAAGGMDDDAAELDADDCAFAGSGIERVR